VSAPLSLKRQPGRPRRCPLEVLVRVVSLRVDGARLLDICDTLNAEHVPTPGGGERWWPSHVHRLLRTRDAQSLMIYLDSK
jgi:recombinase